MVLKIREEYYQAGEDVEGKVEKLTKNCSIKIDKIRINRSRRVKYAIYNIYDPQDWTAHVDYAKTLMLRIFDGNTCVVNVKVVDVKGAKRKLLLEDNGNVYKLKRAKLEISVKPEFL